MGQAEVMDGLLFTAIVVGVLYLFGYTIEKKPDAQIERIERQIQDNPEAEDHVRSDLFAGEIGQDITQTVKTIDFQVR